jgi:hypothetical protein
LNYNTQTLGQTGSYIIGKYRGKVTTPISPKGTRASLRIKSQTPAGKIKGSLSIPGVGDFPFAIKGTINKRGKFNATFNKNGFVGSLVGRVTAKSGLKGLMNVTAGSFPSGTPVPMAGTFNFAKVLSTVH